MKKFWHSVMAAALVLTFLSAAGASEKKLTVGLVVKEPTAPYIQAFMKAAEEKAGELGVNLLIRDGEGDSIKIMDIIDTYMAQGIDAFILGGAVDLRALVPGIRRLNEAKIPVAALDTSPEGGVVDFFLSFDLAQSSAKAAKLFVEGIKNRNGGRSRRRRPRNSRGKGICSAMPDEGLIRSLELSPARIAQGGDLEQHGFPMRCLGF